MRGARRPAAGGRRARRRRRGAPGVRPSPHASSSSVPLSLSICGANRAPDDSRSSFNLRLTFEYDNEYCTSHQPGLSDAPARAYGHSRCRCARSGPTSTVRRGGLAWISSAAACHSPRPRVTRPSPRPPRSPTRVPPQRQRVRPPPRPETLGDRGRGRGRGHGRPGARACPSCACAAARPRPPPPASPCAASCSPGHPPG